MSSSEPPENEVAVKGSKECFYDCKSKHFCMPNIFLILVLHAHYCLHKAYSLCVELLNFWQSLMHSWKDYAVTVLIKLLTYDTEPNMNIFITWIMFGDITTWEQLRFCSFSECPGPSLVRGKKHGKSFTLICFEVTTR